MSHSFSRRSVLAATAATAVSSLTGSLLAQNANRQTPQSDAALFDEAYKNNEYVLPELPYAYDALEPFYNAGMLQIHHDKHHAGYVKGLNEAVANLKEARRTGDYSNIQALSEKLAFNGSGHVLHTLFWHSMKPGGNNGQMPEAMRSALEQSFGSAESAQKQFAEAAKAVEASGWGVLAYEPISQSLVILQAGKHQNLTIWGVRPILVCDVWEHAYYLQYQNNRGQWVDNFMKIADWEFAARLLEEAKAAATTRRA